MDDICYFQNCLNDSNSLHHASVQYRLVIIHLDTRHLMYLNLFNDSGPVAAREDDVMNQQMAEKFHLPVKCDDVIVMSARNEGSSFCLKPPHFWMEW